MERPSYGHHSKTGRVLVKSSRRWQISRFLVASLLLIQRCSAVLYLRPVFTDAAADVRIVIGKTKVAPLKKITYLPWNCAVLLASLS